MTYLTSCLQTCDTTLNNSSDSHQAQHTCFCFETREGTSIIPLNNERLASPRPKIENNIGVVFIFCFFYHISGSCCTLSDGKQNNNKIVRAISTIGKGSRPAQRYHVKNFQLENPFERRRKLRWRVRTVFMAYSSRYTTNSICKNPMLLSMVVLKFIFEAIRSRSCKPHPKA